MYPLALSAQPGAWRLFILRRLDPQFKPKAEKILARDNHSCQFCGFQAMEHQEILNLDQNYYNNRMSNMVTACPFCAQCFFLDAVGVSDYGGGMLIHLPEISQVDLNSFCHVLFCAIANNTPYKDSAHSIYRSLRFRAQRVEEELGEGNSHPAKLGQMLIESDTKPDIREKMLGSVRLLPSRNRFKAQIDHWATAALQEMIPNE